MVTKITVPLSIHRALNYNEQKVRRGVAECLYGHNYLKEAHELNFYEKLARFERLIALNERAHTNSLHISINFSNEDHLDTHQLVGIARDFMEKIGFGAQPYLVYQHYDAGHPHLHVVTTNIQENGKRISIHNIGRNAAARARRAIERDYRLVRAEQSVQEKKQIHQPASPVRALYGKSETKLAVTNVLGAILPFYKYTSLPECNAILQLYNVTADRGKEGSRMYQNKGLVYLILDENGTKIGVPIKASSIYFKPTLAYLEKRFLENKTLRIPHKKRLQTAIDWAFKKPLRSISELATSLAAEQIRMVVRQNEQGRTYGLTFVDLRTKCVFNGSDLGKTYSAQAIVEKLGNRYLIEQKHAIEHTGDHFKRYAQIELGMDGVTNGPGEDQSRLLEVLLRPEKDFSAIPQPLKKQRKKTRPSA